MKFNGEVSILSDPSMLTMLTNDLSISAYQKFLEYYVEDETLVILMSSVEVKNILNCLEWCEVNKVDYGVLTGFCQ